jgi:hypothetical protein
MALPKLDRHFSGGFSLKITALVLLLPAALYGQTGNISGTVTEASGHAALVAAKVRMKDKD